MSPAAPRARIKSAAATREKTRAGESGFICASPPSSSISSVTSGRLFAPELEANPVDNFPLVGHHVSYHPGTPSAYRH